MVRTSKGSQASPATKSARRPGTALLGNPTKAQLEERIAELEKKFASGSAPNTNPHDDRAELLRTIRDLEQENEDLQDTLDQIADAADAGPHGDSLTEDQLKEKLNTVIDLAADDILDEDEDDEVDGN